MIEDIVEFLNLVGYSLLILFKSMLSFFVPNRFKKKDVSNDVILITGGGSGFGRELAIRLGKLGAKIVIWDINLNGLNESEKIFKSLGIECKTYICDITNSNLVYSTANQVKVDVGPVNMLINNAGIVFGGKFMNVNEEQIIKSFHVNILSNFWMIKAFLPDMINMKKGHVVAVSSIAGVCGSVALSAYSATKHAVIGLQESLSLESYFDGYNIKFTTICPFFMNTGMFEGVKSELFPILDPIYTAERAVESILLEKELVFIPQIFDFLYPLKVLFPFKSIKPVYEAVKNHVMMETFVGRADNNN